MRRQTWVLVGPDSNKMLQKQNKAKAKHKQNQRENKTSGLGNVKRHKNLKIGDNLKEDHHHSQQIKLKNFNVSLWDKRKEILNPIPIAIEAC